MKLHELQKGQHFNLVGIPIAVYRVNKPVTPQVGSKVVCSDMSGNDVILHSATEVEVVPTGF